MLLVFPEIWEDLIVQGISAGDGCKWPSYLEDASPQKYIMKTSSLF